MAILVYLLRQILRQQRHREGGGAGGWWAASIRLLLLLVLAVHAVENPPGPDALGAACRPHTLFLRFRNKRQGKPAHSF
jgi:hypothetical protein